MAHPGVLSQDPGGFCPQRDHQRPHLRWSTHYCGPKHPEATRRKRGWPWTTVGKSRFTTTNCTLGGFKQPKWWFSPAKMVIWWDFTNKTCDSFISFAGREPSHSQSIGSTSSLGLLPRRWWTMVASHCWQWTSRVHKQIPWVLTHTHLGNHDYPDWERCI